MASNGTTPSDKSLGTAYAFQGCLVHATQETSMVVMEESVIGVVDGKIVFVDKKDQLSSLLKEHGIAETNVRQLTSSQFLMPGFIDSHAHASQFSFMGTGSDLPLLPWLEKYTYKTESSFRGNPDFARDVYRKCVNRTLRNGTTTVCYFATIDRESTMILVDEIERQGQRAFIGKVNMDCNCPANYSEKLEESLEETKQFIEDVLARKNSLVTPCLTPRFAITCTMELMTRLAELARDNDLPIQTHISENNKEMEFVKELFPESSSYADVYGSAGLLTSKTILAHAVHLTDEELKTIKKAGCGISHCPNSNFSLSSGVLDIRRVVREGVKIGLGTDFAGGHSPSMMDACRLAQASANVHEERMLQDGLPVKPMTYQDMFRMATLGSSQVMGLDHVTGNFLVGKDFDAILADVSSPSSPIDVFPTDSKEDQIQKFIFLGDDRNITKVFVKGREVVSSDSS